MTTVELRKKGTDPTGADPNEQCTVWVEGTTFHWCHVIYGVGRNETDEGTRAFATEDEAVQAVHARVAELTLARFYVEGQAAPPPAEPASQAKKAGASPRWLDAPSKPLLAQRARLHTKAKTKGLAHRFDEIEAMFRPGIDLALKKAKRADLEGVASRIGGDPDLPSSGAWPEWSGAPLTFVAQIAITPALKELDLEGLLPDAGVLSFFAQLDPEVADYGDRCAVLLFPNPKDLVRVPPPAPGLVLQGAGILTPRQRLTVAPSEALGVEALGLTREEQRAYHDDLFLGPIPEGRHHMLLGWPNATTHHDLNGRRFVAQFDSDHRLGFEMGDCETLRFYVDGDKLDASTVKAAACTLSEA